MAPDPLYYNDEHVQIFCGDARGVLPHITADVVVTDPPYGETSLSWDQWPDGWLNATTVRSMWCFGSMRMLLRHGHEFSASGWKLSHDVVWEKPNGSGFQADRFKRVHEHAVHWYRGAWRDVYHMALRVPHQGRNEGRATKRRATPNHTGVITEHGYVDDGTRIARSVQRIKSVGRTERRHNSEKPVALLRLLVEYACPPGGVVIDPFMGSGSTLRAAKDLGRRSIGIEVEERYCELVVQRLRREAMP